MNKNKKYIWLKKQKENEKKINYKFKFIHLFKNTETGEYITEISNDSITNFLRKEPYYNLWHIEYLDTKILKIGE